MEAVVDIWLVCVCVLGGGSLFTLYIGSVIYKAASTVREVEETIRKEENCLKRLKTSGSQDCTPRKLTVTFSAEAIYLSSYTVPRAWKVLRGKSRCFQLCYKAASTVREVEETIRKAESRLKRLKTSGSRDCAPRKLTFAFPDAAIFPLIRFRELQSYYEETPGLHR